MSRTFDCVCMQCMLIVCQRRRRRNEIRKQNKKSNMKVRNGAVWPYNTLFHLVLVQHFHLCEYLLFRFNFVYSTKFCVRVCGQSHQLPTTEATSKCNRIELFHTTDAYCYCPSQCERCHPPLIHSGIEHFPIFYRFLCNRNDFLSFGYYWIRSPKPRRHCSHRHWTNHVLFTLFLLRIQDCTGRGNRKRQMK